MIKKLVLLAVVALFVLTASFFIALNHQVEQPLNIKSAELIEIEAGTSVSSFSKTLVEKSWLKSRFWLRNYVRIHRELAGLKAGAYLIEPGMTALGLLEKIVKGEEHQFSVTFIEGTSFKDWLTLLAEQKYIVHTLAEKNIEQIATAIGVQALNPEGWLYPDTYAFTANVTDLSILQRANQKMKKELKQYWPKRADNLPYDSPYQALIMASIIEKESGKLDEQALIASVFINRLNKKMRLQTDPTVIYGLGKISEIFKIFSPPSLSSISSS